MLTLLPPDAQQREFVHEVQLRLPDEARISCYRTDTDGSKRYGVVFQYGAARHNEVSPVPYYDTDAMVHAVILWINSLHGGDRWKVGVE